MIGKSMDNLFERQTAKAVTKGTNTLRPNHARFWFFLTQNVSVKEEQQSVVRSSNECDKYIVASQKYQDILQYNTAVVLPVIQILNDAYK